jgi:hypothetical protein
MTAVTIAAQVAAIAAVPAGQLPGEVMDAFAGEQAELAARGIPEGIIAAGAMLPDADLLDPFGAPASLHGAVRNQPAVVVLYRGRGVPIATSRYGPTSPSSCPSSPAAESRWSRSAPRRRTAR